MRHHDFAPTLFAMAVEEYEVRDSARRTRTMTAFREGGKLVVVVPEHMTQRQRRSMVPGLVERFRE